MRVNSQSASARASNVTYCGDWIADRIPESSNTSPRGDLTRDNTQTFRYPNLAARMELVGGYLLMAEDLWWEESKQSL